MGARNRVGVWLSLARLHRMAELVSWNRFLDSLNSGSARYGENPLPCQLGSYLYCQTNVFPKSKAFVFLLSSQKRRIYLIFETEFSIAPTCFVSDLKMFGLTAMGSCCFKFFDELTNSVTLRFGIVECSGSGDT